MRTPCSCLLDKSKIKAKMLEGRIAFAMALLPSLLSSWTDMLSSRHTNARYPPCGRQLRLAGGGAVLPCLPFASEEVVHARLIRAAKRGHIEKMHRLVRQGAHVNTFNERGHSPLIKAAERGHTDACIELLKLGADIGFLDRHLSTALHYAAYYGHTRTVILLSQRAPEQINKRNKFGYTPLSYAAADGHTATISALVKLGADVDHLDDMGLGPLHRAAAGGHVSAIRALVQAGASINGVRPKWHVQGAAALPKREVHNALQYKSFICFHLADCRWQFQPVCAG